MTNEERELLSLLPQGSLEDYVACFEEYKVSSKDGYVVVIDVGGLSSSVRRVKATLEELQGALQAYSS